ncbi:MAG: S41 family peptidase [Planctomycetales bacterium]|nr:S41 family peptidase [Planctomycetales bacterium]
MRSALGFVAGFVLAASPAAPAQDARPRAAAGPALFEQVLRTVRRGLFDKSFNGVDLDALAARYRDEAAAAPTARGEREVIRRMLGEIGVSHLSLIEPEVYRGHFLPEMQNERTPQLGLEIARLEEGFFVAGLWEGGAAEKAGVLRGDRIVSVDGLPAGRHPRMLPAGSDPALPTPPGYYLVPPEEGEVSLVLERRPGERLEVWVRPEPGNMVEASLRSVRVIPVAGARVGIMHFWHFLRGEVAKAFEEALAGPFATCDALVLDLRGRGGSVVVLNRILRAVEKVRATAPWGERCAALIDEGSRSAKEIFAWHWRTRAIGPLVGRRTEGAVIAGTFLPMKDGSALLLAVQHVPGYSDGVRLEGVGVAPHFEVPGELPYAAGRDEILEAALKILREKFGLGAPRRPEGDVRVSASRRAAA